MTLENFILPAVVGIEAGVYLENFIHLRLTPTQGRMFRTYMGIVCFAVFLVLIFELYAETRWIIGTRDQHLVNMEYMTYLVTIPFDIALGYSILAPNKSNRWIMQLVMLSEIYPVAAIVTYAYIDNQYIYLSLWAYIILYALVNLLILIKLYEKYEKAVRDNYSDLTGRSAEWIRILMILFVAVIMIELLNALFDNTYTCIIEACANIIIIDVACHYVDKQKPVEELLVDELTEEPEPTPLSDKKETEEGKADDRPTSPSDDTISLTYHYSDIAQKLRNVFEANQMYLEPDINSRDVAHNIGTNERYLSYFLNNVMGKNFHAYISGLRLTYARQLIESHTDMHLADIAYQSGFNAPTTFSMAFKREYGITPKDYHETCLKRQPAAEGEDMAETATPAETPTKPMAEQQDKVKAGKPRSVMLRLKDLGLNERELKLCLLILRDLDSEVIAHEMKISRESLRVTKSRLLKKIDPNQQYHDLKKALEMESEE